MRPGNCITSQKLVHHEIRFNICNPLQPARISWLFPHHRPLHLRLGPGRRHPWQIHDTWDSQEEVVVGSLKMKHFKPIKQFQKTPACRRKSEAILAGGVWCSKKKKLTPDCWEKKIRASFPFNCQLAGAHPPITCKTGSLFSRENGHSWPLIWSSSKHTHQPVKMVPANVPHSLPSTLRCLVREKGWW